MTREPCLRRPQFGEAIELLADDSAEAMLSCVSSLPMLSIAGDLTRGYAWPVPGARLRRSYAVSLLAAPIWPNLPHATAVTIELWWPIDEHSHRLVRTFVAWADDPFNAYLIACCLWATALTGGGAEAAFLYSPDRRVAYRITAAAWTCSQIPAETIARVAATAADRYSTDSLPDTLRTSAMHEERVGGVLTYTGTSAEISACLKADADSREASMDAPAAFYMRNAAEQIEVGLRSEYRGMSHYRVVDASDCAKSEVS